MIYTIGHKQSYERYFEEQGTPQKKGRSPGYDGGSVWNLYEQAMAHCHPGYAVYGVMADWDADTVPSSSGGTWHDLLRDADLVQLLPSPA